MKRSTFGFWDQNANFLFLGRNSNCFRCIKLYLNRIYSTAPRWWTWCPLSDSSWRFQRRWRTIYGCKLYSSCFLPSPRIQTTWCWSKIKKGFLINRLWFDSQSESSMKTQFRTDQQKIEKKIDNPHEKNKFSISYTRTRLMPSVPWEPRQQVWVILSDSA